MESLGNYSFHSFYGSLLSPRELVELAYHLGYRTVGIADNGGFWGAVEFSQACQRVGLQPVLGCRLKLEQLGEVQLTVKDTDGYRALSRYLSLWQMRGKVVALAAFQFFWREFGGHFHLSVRPAPTRGATHKTSDWVIWKRTWDELVVQLGPEIWIELHWATLREQELQRRVFQELRPLTDRWVAMGCARCGTVLARCRMCWGKPGNLPKPAILTLSMTGSGCRILERETLELPRRIVKRRRRKWRSATSGLFAN